MSGAIRLFIVAGEPSGDRLGADLVRNLRKHGDVELAGVGGDELSGEGLRSLYPMSDLSVMGYADVIRRLPMLLWRMRQTARAIARQQPDIVVLVDYQEFNHGVARGVRKRGWTGPMLLYVSPTVWAWKPERAPELAKVFDEVLAILPFEPAAMARLGGPPTHYVGHPALEAPVMPRGASDAGLVALLPGSREGELRRHLQLFRATVERLSQRPDITGFYLPTLPHLAPWLGAELANWQAPVRIIVDRAERPALYAQTRLALVGAGTAVLELALAGVPLVLTYVLERRGQHMRKKFPDQRVSLPNIILREDVVPEVVQGGTDAGWLIAEAETLLDEPTARTNQVAAFARLKTLLETGQAEAPREDAAGRIFAHLQQRRSRA